MDKSLEKIDVIKLLLFLMVFILIVLFMILVLIVPNIKEYRASKSVHNKAYVHKTRVENVLHDRQQEYDDLKQVNRRAILSFAHDFSDTNFIKYAEGFFDNVVLDKIEKREYKEEFTEYEIQVSSMLQTPVNFYNFLEGLNRYENIIQADFPIHMESNASNIDAKFRIKVYDINASK